MKYNLLSLLLLFCFIGIGKAQNPKSPAFIVKGIFVDSLSNEGEPYATIKIIKKSAPNKPVRMAVTGLDGSFSEPVTSSAGDYQIIISSIGKVTLVKDFVLNTGKTTVDLGKLYTSESTALLKTVEVVAQKPLVKVDVDKLAYNVQDDPDSKTNTVLDMLRKVPLVTVDGEDNIKVNGSQNFKIFMNGKPNSMMNSNAKEVLKSLPANSIKNIEVITSPGAKYDAEGVGGILNLVTVDRKLQGYTANISTRVANTMWGNGIYGAIQKGKFTLSMNFNQIVMNSPKSTSNGIRENFESDKEKFLETNGNSKNKGNFQFGNLEASYEIDTLRLLSFGFGMYGGGNDMNGVTANNMYAADHKNIAYGYKALNNGDNSWYSFNGNIDYQRVSSKNKKRVLTLSYKINTNPSTDDFYNKYDDVTPTDKEQQIIDRFFLYNSHSKGKSNTLEQTFQIDYISPIGKYQSLGSGVKQIFRRNTSDNQFFESKGLNDVYDYNEKRSSNYKHMNYITAAYLEYVLQYKKFSLKPGVRYEYTAENVKYILGPGTDFKTSYNDIIPSLMFGFNIGDTQNIRLAYNMRIWRPNISNLNPYFNNTDPMNVSQGNPNLKSEKSHKIEATYSSFSSKFNINLSVSHTFGNDGIQSVNRLITQPGGEQIGEHLVPEGALYSTFKNIGKSKNTSMNIYLGLNPLPKLRLSLGCYESYVDIKSPEQKLHNYGWQTTLFGNAQYTLPLDISMSINAGGASSSIDLQGKGPKYFFYGLNLNRSFLKEKRLTVSAFCNNLFNKDLVMDNEVNGANFVSKTTNRIPFRRFGISISYRLGKLGVSVKKAERSIVNDDLKSGGGNNNAGGGSAGGTDIPN